MKDLIHKINSELLKEVELRSVNGSDPIVVKGIPEAWSLIGAGNYAAVFCHHDFPKHAVKIYADGRGGIEEEKLVYKELGKHESFSECYYYGSNYLVLKRLKGITLYDCLRKGIHIPEKVIEDIDDAIDYARSRGLHPHDIHFKNLMMYEGRGIIVDVSDFLKDEYCPLWHDSKKFYYKVYRRIPFIVPIPELLLNKTRKIYRLYKSFRKVKKKYKYKCMDN